jgi:NitT/TauT family transport system substrate-binding protein
MNLPQQVADARSPPFRQAVPGAGVVFRIFALALAVLTVMPAPASPGQTQADAPGGLIPVNIGYPQANYWPLFVARDLKLFEQAGLAPTFFPFSTGAPLAAEMKRGSIDVAWTGLATVFMLDQGVALRLVLVPIDHSSQMRMVVNPRSKVKTFRDLGQANAIGMSPGTCSEISLVLAAKRAGIPFSTLKISNLSQNLLQGAMQNNQIDTAFARSPYDLQLRAAGFRIAAADKDYVPGGGVCGVTVAIRPAFLLQHPSVGCKMVKVHALALAAGHEDPEFAIGTIQRESGLPRDSARTLFETLAIPPIKSQLDAKSQWSLVNENGGLSGKMQVVADALYAAGVFAQALPKSTIWHAIDASYIKQYLDTDCK